MPRAMASSMATGTISSTRTGPGVSESVAQKVLMPSRISAMSVAKPEKIISPARPHAHGDTAAVSVSPSGLNRLLMMANLARNPASGGKPASSSADTQKLIDSMASAPGMDM